MRGNWVGQQIEHASNKSLQGTFDQPPILPPQKIRRLKTSLSSSFNSMINCKLTGKLGKGVKAHVIPEAFYELPDQGSGPLRLATNTPGFFAKRLPIGIYDRTIVTKEGEARFQPWDDYASQLLLNRFNESIPICDGERLMAWRLEDVNYSCLKLFALSVLWRAHSSGHSAFSKVQLGEHESKIRRRLLDADPGTEEEYSVTVARWREEEFGPLIMDPFQERYDGANYYRFYCGRYVLYIKVDKRRTGPLFREMQLAPGRDLFVVAREIQTSKEFSLMVDIATSTLR